MCLIVNEPSQHLFLKCKIAQGVCGRCFRWIDVLFVQHDDLKNHFEQFCLPQGSFSQNLVWKRM